jgi:hypothetical protein
VARKREEKQSGDFITAPVLLPAINFNVSITPQIRIPDYSPDSTGEHYLSFVYEVSKNDSQPCMVEEITFSRNGVVSIDTLISSVQPSVDYVSQYIEEVMLSTVSDLIAESRVACFSKADVKEKLAGVMQFVLDTHGTAYKAGERKSYLHYMLGNIAREMCHRVQGGRSYATVKKEKKHKKNDSKRPLNPRQLQWLCIDFDYGYEQIKKARKAPDGMRGKFLGNQPDRYILDAIEERKSETNSDYKWDPKQIAYVYAARKAGAKNATMSQWKTIKGQLEKVMGRDDKVLTLYSEEESKTEKKKPILSGKKRQK